MSDFEKWCAGPVVLLSLRFVHFLFASFAFVSPRSLSVCFVQFRFDLSAFCSLRWLLFHFHFASFTFRSLLSQSIDFVGFRLTSSAFVLLLSLPSALFAFVSLTCMLLLHMLSRYALKYGVTTAVPLRFSASETSASNRESSSR